MTGAKLGWGDSCVALLATALLQPSLPSGSGVSLPWEDCGADGVSPFCAPWLPLMSLVTVCCFLSDQLQTL